MLDERQQQRGQIALQKIYELRDLINEGNRETAKPRISWKSEEIYSEYWNRLIDKLEEITGVRVDFSYYTTYYTMY